MNFWEKMQKPARLASESVAGRPILCLAPMADVTDAAFRYVISKHSTIPHVTFTEFVSADGLALAPKDGRKKLLKNLEYSEIERPIVAQFFGNRPDTMKKAAALAVKLGFDGVDINMGCPDKKVEKQNAGASLMKDPKLARELIAAAKAGISEAAKKLKKDEIPVSVKTRLGYNRDELEEWLPELLAENPAAIIIHARTRKEMSKVPARWERIKRATEIRDIIYSSSPQPQKCTDIFLLKNSSCSRQSRSQGISGVAVSKILIIGNGDVLDIEDAYKKCDETGADGAMIGRAVFGNPWLFSDLSQSNISAEKRLKALIEHAKLFEKKFMGKMKCKNFAVMKKHFKSYLSGIPKTKKLKEELMKTKNAAEAEKLLSDFRLPIE